MKRNEITAGVEYAYEHSNDIPQYGAPRRVRVLEVGVEMVTGGGYYSQARQVKGVRVEAVDGKPLGYTHKAISVVETRYIHMTWARWEQVAAERSKRTADAEAIRTAQRKALNRLVDGLKAAGIINQDFTTYGDTLHIRTVETMESLGSALLELVDYRGGPRFLGAPAGGPVTQDETAHTGGGALALLNEAVDAQAQADASKGSR